MYSPKRIALGAIATIALSSMSQAQGWRRECIDPMNTAPYSPDYSTQGISDALIGCSAGISGTVTYGPAVCYNPARTLRAPGRLAFFVGSTGSVQSTFDDNLALTTGAPTDPVGDYCFGKILKDGEKDGNSVLYGDSGLRTAYVGASKRYMITAWSDADVDVEVQVKVLGDALRIRWRMRNLKADGQRLGLLFGCYPGMRSEGPDSTGANQANSLLFTRTGIPKLTAENYIGYAMLPNGKPVRNERRYDINSLNFPAYANFQFGQTDAYGMRVDNTPPTYTPDATAADLFLIGNHGNFQSPGLLWNNTIRTVVFGDTENNPNPKEEADVFLNEISFVQRFPTQLVAPGDSRDVVQYIHAPWSVADYEDPYTVVLDGPRLIATEPTGKNGLTPNPMQVRAYVDNQYATLDREVALHQVRLTIFLPKGLTLASGESQQKTINVVAPNEIASVDWSVVADGKIFGDLPYEVTIEPTPGPKKTLKGVVRVSSTPRLELPPGANLVTIPYSFQDTSMDDILKLQSGIDYVAYRWDPDQSQYVPALSVDRGVGYWILPKTDLGYKALQGAVLPPDQATGGLLVSLHQGWNLIGNPYSFAVPLNQLVLAVEDSPKDTYTWVEAVANNFVQSSLIFWQRDDALPGGGSYNYTAGSNDSILPHKGYWIYVSTFKPVRISWPPIFAEGLPNSGRAPSNPWTQNDRNWRLQLSARGTNGIDAQNYVGVVSDKKLVAANTLRKAPASPGQNVELYIESVVDGKNTHLSQLMTDRGVRKEWNLSVKAKEPGDVTVTWPNLPSVPRSMRFRITDTATGEAHDLRSVSGYTFRMAEPGVRKFKLTMEPGGSTRPVIGNVLVSRTGGAKSINSPVTVSYALSADALVTVRILSNLNKEVYTVTHGRPDAAGQNSITWTLRDNANRAVAPGQYNVEILAETPNGERVRRIVPINVTR